MLTVSFYWRRFLTEMGLKIWTTIACKKKKNKNKKNNISFGWSNIIFFTVYNDRLNTFENKNVINSKSWLKYSKMAENIERIICWYQKIYFLQCLCFLKITHLWKSCICWLDSIRLSSSCETQRILIEMV